MRQTARSPTGLTIALALLVTLAGCLGQAPGADDGADPASTPLPDVHDDAPPDTPGAIRGVVADAAHHPLEGATVTLLRENQTVTTGPDGRYAFTGLANATYLVVASHPDHLTATQQAVAENGTVFELDFRLQLRPGAEPHQEVIELAGFLACHGVVKTTQNETRYDCGYLDPNQRHRFEVAVREGLQGLVVETTWDANTPASRRLHVSLETVGYGADDAPLGDATGDGYARVQASQAALEKYYPRGGDVRVTVLPAPSLADEEAGADGGFTLQQSFTVVVTAFYNAPAPPGYSVFDDA